MLEHKPISEINLDPEIKKLHGSLCSHNFIRKKTNLQLANHGTNSILPEIPPKDKTRIFDAIGKLAACGDYLEYWNYLESGTTTLQKYNSCDVVPLCPFCCKKLSKKLITDVLGWMNESLTSTYYLFTITTPNLVNLTEARKTLAAIKKQWFADGRKLRSKTQRHKFSDGYYEFFENFEGGFLREEIKRGKNSGLWHAHFHGILKFKKTINYKTVRQAMAENVGKITGSVDNENTQIDILQTPDRAPDFKGILEACKYATDLKLYKDKPDTKQITRRMSDLWEIYQNRRELKIKGMTRFGNFRGVSQRIDPVDPRSSTEHYVKILLEWSAATGYHVTEEAMKATDIYPLLWHWNTQNIAKAIQTKYNTSDWLAFYRGELFEDDRKILLQEKPPRKSNQPELTLRTKTHLIPSAGLVEKLASGAKHNSALKTIVEIIS